MTKNSLLLTKQEALALLPFSRRGLDSLIKKGEIGYKKVGSRYYFLKSDIEKWAMSLDHHTDYSSVGKPTMPTSHSIATGNGYSLENLAEQYNLRKPKHIAITA